MSPSPKTLPAEDLAIYEFLSGCAENGRICPSNEELMLLSGIHNESSLNRRLKRLKERGYIKVNSKGGFRQIYIIAIDKWTCSRPPRTQGPISMWLNMEIQEDPTTIQEQCMAHTAQLKAVDAWFESHKVKPMRTLDWTQAITPTSYGVVNYSAIGWR